MAVANYSFAEDCWVDVFSEPHFRGRMRRLRLDKWDETSGEHDVSQNKIGSMIVGPGATATLQLTGPSHARGLKINPRKIIADVPKRCGEQAVLKLLIERASALEETNARAFIGSRHGVAPRRRRIPSISLLEQNETQQKRQRV